MASLPGADGAVLEAGRDIMLAAMTEQRGEEAEAGADAEKSKNLKAKVMRIKGEITREAITREAAMHDKDESLALTAAIKGATLANYVEMVGFVYGGKEGHTVTGIRCVATPCTPHRLRGRARVRACVRCVASR